MAAKTYTGSGLWSTAANWSSGTLPVSTDTVTIASQTVTFDVDQNAFAAGIAVTLNSGGVLTASQVYGTYASCDDANDIITVNETHGWAANQRVVYRQNSAASPIGNLTDGTTYYIKAPSGATFQLSTSAGGAAIDVTGTAGAHTFEPIYCLKLNGNLTVNSGGTLSAGASSPTYPIQCVFNIIVPNNFAIKGAGTISLYCTPPPTTYCVLSSAYTAASDDHVHVTFPTASQTYWHIGDSVRIDNVPYTTSVATTSQLGTISSLADNQINMVSTKPANNKAIGAYVFLVQRNVRITGGGGTAYAVQDTTGTVVLNCEISGNGSGGMRNCTGTTSMGGIISGGTVGVVNPTAITTISGVVTGQTSYGINGGSGVILSGIVSGCQRGLFSIYSPILTSTSIVTGCSTGVYSCYEPFIAGIVKYGVNAVLSCVGTYTSGANFNNNSTSDVFTCYIGRSYNTTFASTEMVGYNTAANRADWYWASRDHDGSSGAFKAWSKGGITTKQTGTKPTGYAYAYQIALESASYWGIYQESYTVEPGATLKFIVYVTQSATAMTAAPKVEIVAEDADNLLDSATYSALATATHSNNNTASFEALPVSWQNTGTVVRRVILRVSGKNATGSVTCLPVEVLGMESWG